MMNTLIFLFYLLCLSVSAAAALAEYILYGMGLHAIARLAGMDNEWLSFVPFAL